MALNTLTLASPLGVKGRPFRSKIEGLTAGTEVTADSDFGVLNGILVNAALPNVTAMSVSITERVPATGETKTTRVEIEVFGHAQIEAEALDLVPEGETFLRASAFPQRDADGSFDWYAKATTTDGERLVAELIHGGEEGAPEWVPMGAFGFIDFANDRAWNGIASVALTDVISDDTDGSFGGDFVASQVIADEGYVGDSNLGTDGQIIGTLKPAILEGSAIVIEFEITAPGGSGDIYLYAADYSTAINLGIGAFANLRDDGGFSFDIGPNQNDEIALPVPGTYKCAANLVDGAWKFVVGGFGSVYTASNTLSGEPITELSLTLADGMTLRSIANHDAADDAALAALVA